MILKEADGKARDDVMMEDSILRCLVEVKLDGIFMPQILDTVPDGEFYMIVLEWGELNGARRAPRQYVRLGRSEFHVDDSISGGYELVCETGIDLDGASTSDLSGVPMRFFQDRPDSA